MKRLKSFLFVLTVFVIVCLFNFLLSDNFKGKEEDTQEETYYDKIGFSYVESDNLDLYEYTRYEYDDDGNMTEKNTYDRDGKLYKKEEWEYDDKGNCISEYYISGIGHGWAISHDYKYVYKYDNDNNIIHKIKYEDNIMSYFESYRYLGDIMADVIYYYDKNGSISGYNKEIYSKSGHELCCYRYNSDGIFTGYIYTRYDEKDRCIFRAKGKDEDNPQRILKAAYDDNRYVGKQVYKAELGLVKVQLNKFTEDGDVIRNLKYTGPEGEEWLDENNIHGYLPRDKDGGKLLEEGYWADYDNNRHKINEMNYDALYNDYKLRSYVIYAYDNNDNISRKIEFRVDDNSDNIYYREVTSYQYDKSGRLKLEYTEEYNDNVKRISQDYEDGSRITLEFYDNESLLSVTKKDEQGNLSEKIKFDEDGEINCKEVYLYDGNECKVNVYDIEDNLLYVKE
ncbi:MAG: hypothetical protein HDT39_14350 [Lachnospiraceae bacterium]|nr:hypothetical protein [Lachnospiraceae bacterium]